MARGVPALNRLLASNLYLMAAVAVVAIHRFQWILTIGAVVPAVRVNRITGRRKEAQKGCEWRVLVVLS